MFLDLCFGFFGFFKLIDLEISCRRPWLKNSEGSYVSSYGPGRFSGFLTPHTGPSWTRDGAHPGTGTGPILEQGLEKTKSVFFQKINQP